MSSPGPRALAAARPVAGLTNASRVWALAQRSPIYASRWASPARAFSLSATPARPIDKRSLLRSAIIAQSSQYRTFGFGSRSGGSSGISRGLLATSEATANRNPNSANAQNGFYQLLLKANMPAIIVERYQSGLYASNDAADAAYGRALDMLQQGSAESASTQAASYNIQGGRSMSSDQVQAIAQAVATRVKGKDMMAKGGDGTKAGPLHVIIEESWGKLLYRWVKTILTLFIGGYVLMTGLTLAVSIWDSTDMIKREAKKGKSFVKAESQKAKFSDVHGCDEAKEELVEVVEFLKNPSKFNSLGGKLPKGVLLVGPPGTGKTLLARAVAGESGVPFFYMSGSEFDEVYVGVGAKRVRELFNAAKQKSPAIIFIDELDAIGGKRQQRDAAYMKQTLNQLLTELDGFQQETGVIVIAATNHPQLLDKALVRPGRFDRHVVVDLPDVRGRLAILQHHAKKIKLNPDASFKAIASRSGGLSGAELENIVNQAAVRASKAKAADVTMRDLEWAMDKVIMGAERRLVVSPEEKLMTAYHEAGHALVMLFAEKAAADLHKVTILSRGQSLGHTAWVPEMDKHSYSLSDYVTMIRTCLGGKIAEELAFGTDAVTSGVSNDLQVATKHAFSVVGSFGMSTKLAPMDYANNYENLSTETRAVVEHEVSRLLTQSADDVRTLLTARRKELDLLAKALVEYETLDKSEVEKVIRGESLGDRVKGDPGRLAVPVESDQGGAGPGGVVTPPVPPVSTGKPPNAAA